MTSNKSQYNLLPSPALSPYIKYYWILNTGTANLAPIQTIPTGCMHLVFHRGKHLRFSSGNAQPQSFVRGQLSVPDILHSASSIDMIAIVFNPLGMNLFFPFPMEITYNKYIDVDDLGDKGLIQLKELIFNEEDVSTCINYIERFLLQRIANPDTHYKRIVNSTQIIKAQPEVSVTYLADQACLGYRHFKRVFTSCVGMNPKEYIKVVRFQRALYTLQHNPGMEITQLAHACGFYDHPHFVKDFKALSGSTPTHYLQSRVPYSTLFSTDCRLNLIANKQSYQRR